MNGFADAAQPHGARIMACRLRAQVGLPIVEAKSQRSSFNSGMKLGRSLLVSIVLLGSRSA